MHGHFLDFSAEIHLKVVKIAKIDPTEG